MLCSETQKKSAKGVSRKAQEQLSHDVYKNVLEQCSIVRLPNVRIESKNHEIFTVETNKIALTAFDDKRFIQDNGVDTLPFGHYSLQDRCFERMIAADPNWGYDDEDVARNYDLNFLHSEESLSFSPPDPGMHQPQYNDSDLEGGLVDFDNLSETEETVTVEERCPFIIDEAEEVDDDFDAPVPPKKQRRRAIVLDSDED